MIEETETKPQISVVITCFNRRKFLIECVKSALQQTLPRDKYEILVTKNFEDGDIDLFLSQNGIFSIIEGDVNIGTMIANAVFHASGQYVCFLDDDDIFYPDKLSTIFETTIATPTLVYYHNAFDTIDSKSVKMRDYRHRHPENQIILNSGYDSSAVKRAKALSGSINMSSITVRRDLIIEYAQVIRDITGLQDVFLFYLCALSRVEMMLDPRVLTGYRIHTSESHGDLADIENYSTGNRNVLRKYLKSYEILMTSGNNTLIDLRYEYLTNKCRYQLMLSHRTGMLNIKELLFLLLHLEHAEEIKNQIFLIVFSITHRVMPGRTASFYLRWKMKLDSSKYSEQNEIAT